MVQDQNAGSLGRSFHEDGYIFFPGFITEEEVAVINKRLEKIIPEVVPVMQPHHVFYENKNDPATLKQLQDIHEYDDFFWDILNNSKFQKMAELLLEEEVIGKTLEYFNKPAKIGKPTPPHQDGFYFMVEPTNAVTMWIALEDADTENGCIRYVKGSHLKGMRPHARTQTAGFSQGIMDYGKQIGDKNEMIFPAKPGDMLVHHALTIHRADGNTSEKRSRRSLGLVYFGRSAKEDLTAKKTYQKELNKI